MNKTLKVYGILLAFIMVVVLVMRLTAPVVTNWQKNYDVREKTPFGLYIFNQEADKFFNGKLRRVEDAPYGYYDGKSTRAPHNILVIARRLDHESWRAVLREVSNGSDMLLINDNEFYMGGDTLDVRFTYSTGEARQTLRLTDRKLKNDSLFLDRLPGDLCFSKVPKDAEILGYATGLEQVPNFVKLKVGRGHVYMHTEPLFLTNYYLLHGNNSKKYIEDVFGYLPNRETVWFRDAAQKGEGTYPALAFILSQPALKYAWWTLLGSTLLFVVFAAKRQQRIIPVVEPLKNKSVEFVRSIGNLYLQEGDFHDMMNKKSQYFLHRVRTDLLLDTNKLDEQFAEKVQLKTGAPLAKILDAVNLIKKAQDPSAPVTQQDFVRFNKILDEILKQ